MGDWIIKDDGAADWALEKIKNHRATIKTAEEKYKSLLEWYKERCEKCLAAETREAKAAIESLSASLEEYLYSQGKDKIKLPFGSFGFTTEYNTASGEKASCDNSELLKLCEEKFPQFVKAQTRIVAKVDWAGFKKNLSVDEDGDVVTKDGEIVDLYTARKFTVKTADDND